MNDAVTKETTLTVGLDAGDRYVHIVRAPTGDSANRCVVPAIDGPMRTTAHF